MSELEKDAKVIALLRNGTRPGDTPLDRARASAEFGNRAQSRWELLTEALADISSQDACWPDDPEGDREFRRIARRKLAKADSHE